MRFSIIKDGKPVNIRITNERDSDAPGGGFALQIDHNGGLFDIAVITFDGLRRLPLPSDVQLGVLTGARTYRVTILKREIQNQKGASFSEDKEMKYVAADKDAIYIYLSIMDDRNILLHGSFRHELNHILSFSKDGLRRFALSQTFARRAEIATDHHKIAFRMRER